MKCVFFNHRKKGNVILITICIIIALLLLLVSFLKSTTNRIHSTKKIGTVLVAREFASSLAFLFNDYIKVNELKKDDSELKKVLSMAYEDMADKTIIDITEEFKNFIKENVVNNDSEDILTLLEKNSGLNQLKWTLAWCIKKEDFETIKIGNTKEPPYPREKTGLIRYHLSVSYVPPGSKTAITEDYVFISSMNVIANIFPVLSKFNLYVEDALDGEEPNATNRFRFNIVDTMASGDLNNGATIRPWVLNNGEASTDARNTYNDLVEDPRGFVYIGGGTKQNPILLGIARGWADEGFGKYGEDFHFFKNENKKAGYWKTLDVWNQTNRQGIMTSNIGLCNDVSDDNLLSWHEQLGELYGEVSKYHSLFKLYGTDSRKSPTMVLGYVDSLCDSIRIFKNGNSGVYFLGYINTEPEFLSGLGYEIDEWEPFGSGYMIKPVAEAYMEKFGSELDYETYNKNLSSRLLSARYNTDYTYILTNNMVDFPIERGRITDQKLKDLCDINNETILNQVPFVPVSARYNEIFGDDLTKLDTFLDKTRLFIDGSEDGSESEHNNQRLLCSKKIKDQQDFESFLQENQFKIDNNLDLNGFVYLDLDSDDDSFELDLDKIKVIRNGGIILSKGNIRIKGDINSEDKIHLTLLALTGNIIIERGVQNINASLIAGGGQVKLEGDAKDSELTVNGNIVMKKINRGNIKNDSSIGMKRGLNLNYNNKLSAIPFNATQDSERTEESLLMFSLKDDLIMLD